MSAQQGPAAQALITELTPVLEQQGQIQRAYLVRASASPNGSPGVVLALRGTDPRNEMAIVEAVGAVFARLFNRDEHLDILFLDEDGEQQARTVGTPFFERR